MTCKDCVHYDICDFWVVEENTNKPCETVYHKNRFMDKSKFVEVIRCKDCKFRGTIFCRMVHETLGNGLLDYTVDNGYCETGMVNKK